MDIIEPLGDANLNELICLIAAETVLLAFQNYILMLGTSAFIPALLVPAMGGSDVSLLYMSHSFTQLHCL